MNIKEHLNQSNAKTIANFLSRLIIETDGNCRGCPASPYCTFHRNPETVEWTKKICNKAFYQWITRCDIDTFLW